MNLLHDLLSLTALLSLLAVVRQRTYSSTGLRISHPPAIPPDVSLIDLTHRQLGDWRALLAESERNDSSAEQVDYCRRQISRFEADLTRLNDQTS